MAESTRDRRGRRSRGWFNAAQVSLLLVCVEMLFAFCDANNFAPFVSGSGSGILLRPTEVYNLQAEYNEDSNIINVTWTDSSNFPDEELGYQITYSIAARNVTLLNANDTIYNASVNQTSALFEYQITENVLPGVTVTITVQPCNRFGLGPPRTTSETVPGVFAPAPINFAVDSSSSLLSSIVLQWNIPYEQVPPDRFDLEYTLTKLSGEPASQTQFFVMLNDSNRTYTVESPLSYTQYQFRLFAFYGDDRSDEVTTSHQTPEAMPGPVRNLNIEYMAELTNFNSESRMYELNVTISWEAPLEPRGNIQRYNYRLVETDNAMNIVIDDNTADLSVERNVTVTPYTNYTVTVVAFTSAGMGDSVMQVALSPEAVPGPVQNVELVFLNTDNFDRGSNMYNLNVTISWEAPSNPNGVILGYNYSLMETSNSSNVIIEYTNTTMLSVQQSVMVAPFTNYTATVVAFTSEGSGEPVMEVALSPEATPGPVQNLMVTFLSESAIYTDANRTYYLPVSISWQPPQYPNGGIITYRYSLVETNAPSTVIISDTNTSGTVLSIEPNVTVSPFTNYTATVVAFTSEGSGEPVTQVALSPKATPGPVQNLTVSFLSESATYNIMNRTYDIPVSISWQPPEYPNGEIVMYNYRLVETNADGRVVIDGNVTSTELSVEQNVTVSPFTNYTATVVAFTSVGSGDSVVQASLSPEATPGPVRSLMVSFINSVTFDNVTRIYNSPVSISWQPPEFPNGDIITYNYRLVETNENDTMISANITGLSVEESVTVSPFTNYTATVVAFTSAGSGEPVMQVALSPEAMPGPVQRLRVDYTAELTNFNRSSRMYDLNVTISWEAPFDPRGVIQTYSYRLVETDSPNNMIIEYTNTSLLSVERNVMVSPFTNYTATVVAFTSAGMGESAVRVSLSPEAVPSPVQNLSVTFLSESSTYNSTARTYYIPVNISWEPPEFPNGVIITYSYQLEDPNTNEIVLIGNTTATNLSVEESVTVSPFTNYTATVVAFTSEGSGDAAIEVVTSPEAVPGPVRNVELVFLDTDTSNFDSISNMYNLNVSISWDPPSSPNGVILGYNYSLMETSNSNVIIEYTNTTLLSAEQSVMVAPFTNYTATVVAFTSAGSGEPVIEVTLSPEAMPGPVRNVELVFLEPLNFNSESRMYDLNVTISWEAPLEPRGVIQRYNYRLVETDNAMNIVIDDNTTDMSVECSVTVFPYTNYTATVVAFTSAGGGEPVLQVALSPEAVPGPVQNVELVFLNTDNFDSISNIYNLNVNISWETPSNPNGVILGYNYSLMETSNSNNVIIEYTNTTMLSVEPSVMVAPFTNYTATVVAFTSAGSGEPVIEVALSPEAMPGPVRNVELVFLEPLNFNSESRMYELNVTISWEAPSEPRGVIQRYNYRLVETDNAMNIVIDDTTTDMSVECSVTVFPYTNYTATVVAFTSAGGGEPVMEVALSPEAIPGPVRNVDLVFLEPANFNRASRMYNLNVNISWETPSDPNGVVLGYNYSLMETNNSNNVIIQYTNTTMLSAEHNVMVAPFTNYTATVVAFTSAGRGEPVMEVALSPEAAPGPVQNLTVSFLSESATYNSTTRTYDIPVNISWQPPEYPNGEIVAYSYCLVETNAPNTNIILDINTTQLSIQRSVTVAPFTNYTVTVVAFTSAGSGDSVMDVALSPEAAPTQPQGVTAEAINSTAVRASWQEPMFPNGIIRQYIVNISDGSIVVARSTVTGDILSTEVFDLMPYTLYSVVVYAVTVETGEPSDFETVRTSEAAPTEVRNLVATRLDFSLINITWDEPQTPNGIVSYEVSITGVDLATQLNVLSKTAVTNETQYSVETTLEVYARYVVMVTAMTGGGPAQTVVTNLTTPEGVPEAPRNLTVVNVTNTSSALTWLPPSDSNGVLTSYTLILLDQNGELVNTTILDSDSESFQFEDLLVFMKYQVVLFGNTSAGRGMDATVDFMTDIGIPLQPRNVTASPNAPRTLLIEWAMSAVTNGPITSYNVVYMLVAMGTRMEDSTNAMSLLLDSLEPFANYTVTVQACTDAGCGPFSEEIFGLTQQEAPSVPENVTISDLNATSVDVSWDAPSSPNGILLNYTVYYALDMNGAFPQESSVGVDAISGVNRYTTTLTDLMEFSRYRVQITAATVAGESERTRAVFVETDPDSASPPQFVFVATINSTAVELSWGYPTDPRGNISGYIIRHNATTNGSFEMTNITLSELNDQSDQSYLFGGLSPFTNYSFQVAAYSFSNDFEQLHMGLYNDPAAVNRTDEAAPSAPLAFELVTVDGNSTILNASWAPPNPPNGIITAYTVYCNVSTGQFYPEQVPTGNTVFTVEVQNGGTVAMVTGLTAFTRYECFVTANTSVGEGEASNTHAARTDESAPTDPPQNLNATVRNSRTVFLQWSRPSTPNGIITSYTLVYSNATLKVMMMYDNTTLEDTVENLNEFTNYTFELSANTSVGGGPPAIVMVTTDEDAPSGPPENLMGEFINSTSLRITWDPPLPNDQNGVIRGYNVSYNVSADESIFVHGTTVELGGLQKFTFYNVSVQAFTVGSGPIDSTVVQTDSDVPSEPLNVSVINLTSTSFTVTWLPPANPNGIIDNYTLEYTDITARMTTTETGITTERQALVGLRPFWLYRVVVYALTDKGPGPGSVPLDVTTLEDVPSDEPQGFMATVLGPVSIFLRWNPPTMPNGILTNYTLRYSNSTDVVNVVLGGTVTNFTADNLNEATTYFFQLNASTLVGYGPAASANATTDEDAPSGPPQNLTGEFINSTSLRITWDPPLPNDQNGVIRGYNVSYNVSAGGEESVFVRGTTVELGGLQKFTFYNVSVQAFTVGSGPIDSTVVQTDSDVPSAPLNVTYENLTATSIRVFWSTPAEPNGIIDNYTIEYTDLSNNEMLSIDGITSTFVNITGLMEYQQYTIIVYAYTDKGRGNGSDPLVILTAEHFPDEPTNFTIATINSTALEASWGKPIDPNGIIEGYQLFLELVFIDASYLGNDSRMFNLSASDFSQTIGDLHPFATYRLDVRAITSVGPGNRTSQMARTDEDAPSEGVRNVTVDVTNSTAVQLSWLPPPTPAWNGQVVNYTIRYWLVDSCPSEPSTSPPNASMVTLLQFSNSRLPSVATSLAPENITIGKLEEFQSYSFSISIATSVGFNPPGDNGNICDLTEPALPASPPTIQSFIITTNTTATMSWVPPPSEDINGIISSYVISVTNTNASTSRNVTSPRTSVSLPDLVPFTVYRVQVAAQNQVGVGPFSSDREDMTLPGAPEMPRNLQNSSTNSTTITLTWDSPTNFYGNPGPYSVNYQGFKEDNQQLPGFPTVVMTTTIMNTTVELTGLSGGSIYQINVSASTVDVGNGSSASLSVTLPAGSPPVLDYNDYPQLIPRGVDNNDGQPVRTTTSFRVDFTLPNVIGENGPVDSYRIYVQRQPSQNPNISNYYESVRATSNYPQYAALQQPLNTNQRRKRQASSGTPVEVTVGGTDQCGPMDEVCNGPLQAGADYAVRYRLYSGSEFQDYGFHPNASFSTAPGADATVSPGADATVPAVVVVVVLLLVVAIVVTVVVVIVIVKYRQKTTGKLDISKKNGEQLLPRTNGSTKTSIPFLGPSDPGIVPLTEAKQPHGFANPSSPTVRSQFNKKIYLRDFVEYVRNMLDDSGYKFSEEYERVTEIGLDHAKEASLMADNRAKNRYTNILAYDHSRVKLSFVDDEPGSDYINACYIPGYRMRRAYVATQGPLPATFDDFWRMVWEQNTHTIVMLTQLVERGRTKCHRYWPGMEPQVYGDIAVEMMSEKDKVEWTIREFKLSVSGKKVRHVRLASFPGLQSPNAVEGLSGKKVRHVRHFQFTSWPDHGVPETPTPVIDFVQTVRAQVEMQHGPIVVHCSAGVGRTGCFISLDFLLQHINDNDWIDIFGIACEMRQHRNHMIQTEAQYVFIHKAMVEVMESMSVLSKSIHYTPGYSPGIYANQFTDDNTQMTDYYGDCLSEETHM